MHREGMMNRNHTVHSFYRRHRNGVTAALMLIPLMGWWFVVSGGPLLFGLILGFFDWHSVLETPKWAGLGNFVSFFTNPNYVQTLWNAIWIGLLTAIVTNTLGLGAALLMNADIRGRGFYRTIWYVPAVTAAAATTQIFNMWLDPSNVGLFNNLLRRLGMEPVIWQYSTAWMVFWIVVYTVWKGLGTSAILWLAGLSSVDPQLREAARVDGCRSAQVFRHVTLPSLRPFITFIGITATISAVQIYEQVIFISGGGPFGSTNVLMTQIYRDAFVDFNLGMAGAGGMILAAVILLLTWLNWQARDKEA
jgi:ABC-type sugar transport system permease subunit